MSLAAAFAASLGQLLGSIRTADRGTVVTRWDQSVVVVETHLIGA